DQAGSLILPVELPEIRVAGLLCPFLADGDVPDRGIEPHVDDFTARVDAGVPGDVFGYRYSPRYIARYRTVLHAILQPAPHLAHHVRLAVRMRFEPLLQALLVLSQRQIPVGRLAQLGCGIRDRATRVLQLRRAERGAAVFALVAIGILVAANRTRAAHESIGKEDLGLGVV